MFFKEGRKEMGRKETGRKETGRRSQCFSRRGGRKQ